MISKISQILTSFFIRKKSISEEEREIYIYCFEIFVATALNIVLLFVVGLIMGRYIETIVFTIVFMLLRGVGGGAHAKSHRACILGLMIIFMILLLTMNFHPMLLSYVSIAMLGIFEIVSFGVTPVDSKNKRIDTEQRKRLKKTMNGINLILICVFFILRYFERTRVLAYTLSYASFSVSILFLIGFVKNKNEEKRVKRCISRI